MRYQPGEHHEPESLTPVWMAVVLLAAIPGVLLLLLGARSAFVDNPLGAAAPNGIQPDIRFIDRATTWVQQNLGGTAGWASLAALAGFTVVVVCRRQKRLPTARLMRLTGVAVAAGLAGMELAGPISMAVGFIQLAADPTAARDLTGQLAFLAPLVVLCLVLAVLASLLAWVLGHAHEAIGEGPPAPQPGATTDHDSAVDPVDIYRRPT